MVENANIAIKNRFVAAVFAADARTIGELADPEFELQQSLDLPYGGNYRGADGFMQFLQRFMATYAIERMAETRMFHSSDPDLLLFEFDVRATVKASGRPFETSILETWQFRNGRVLTIKPHYFNVPR